MYLELFHGRNHPDERLEDWGFQGPVVGPFTNAHVTYNVHIKLWHERLQKTFEVPIHDDMVELNGKYYGDWVFLPSCPAEYKDRKVSLQKSGFIEF
jgi:hypothetical protein